MPSISAATKTNQNSIRVTTLHLISREGRIGIQQAYIALLTCLTSICRVDRLTGIVCTLMPK